MKLKIGEIDADIWNLDEVIERKLSIKYYSLAYENVKGDDTEDVKVVNWDNYGIRNLFIYFINKNDVIEYQKQVVKEALIPNY